MSHMTAGTTHRNVLLKTFSPTRPRAGILCRILMNTKFKVSTIESHNRKRLTKLDLIFHTEGGKDDTKSSPEWRNNEANMSRWNSVSGLSPPAWLPHKGRQSSAETAPSRGLSVSVWMDMRVHEREREERNRTTQRLGERQLPT